MRSAVKKILYKTRLLLAAFLLLGVQALAPISTFIPKASAAAVGADIDQWANSAPASWQNGNLNANNSVYREGDSVPFRSILTGLTNGTHTLDIEYDNVDGSKHAYDYLTSFDLSYTPNPCSGVAITCAAGTPGLIPTDPTLSPIPQVSGQIKVYGADITSVAYLNTPGHSLASAKKTSVRVTFTTANPIVVIAWGGHIAKESEWGVGTGASAVPGSPYHQRILALDGAGGNQDRSLAASAIAPAPTITTQASAASITLGQNVTDAATLVGPNHNSPTVTGAIKFFKFFVCGPNVTNPDCSAGGAQVGSSITLINGVATSASYTPNSVGRYCFRAEYTPLSTSPYSPQSHTNTSTECFSVLPAPSSITIIKDAKPNRADDFSFTTTGSGLGNFALDDDSNGTLSNTKTFTNLNPGTYTISETAVSGWDLKSIVCSGATTSVNNNSVDITLTGGQSALCTFTNVKRGTITVYKQTIPSNDSTLFPITISGNGTVNGAANASISTTAPVVFDVSEGSYSVEEQLPNGWTQTSNTCTTDNLAIVVTNSTTNDQLNKTCTITNAKLAKLKIVKDALPNNAQDFSFTATGAGVNGFALDDDTDPTLSNSIQFNDLTPGSFTFTEAGLKGWAMTDASCTGAQNFIEDLQNGQLSVTLAYGDDATCTFTNEAILPILTLIKIVSNLHGGALTPQSFVLKIGDTVVASQAQNTLSAGSYVASEINLPGYSAGNWTGDCDSNGNIALALGDSKTCTITNNDIAPKLTITKKTLPSGSEKEFNFTSEKLNGFTLSDGESEIFSDLQADNYTISEDETDGWYLKAIDCGNAEGVKGNLQTRSITASLEIGDDVTCEITNEELSLIKGSKFEDINFDGEWDEGEPTLEGWKITLTQLCEGEGEDGEPVMCEGTGAKTDVTDEKGEYKFENLRSGYYMVCEEMQDGWIQTRPAFETGDNCHYIELAGEGDQECEDFGNFREGRIHGVKFNDVNGNHTRDDNEPTLKDWEITLTKHCVVTNVENLVRIADSECKDEVLTTTTDVNGAYGFDNLEPGDYTVCETQQTNWTQTYPETEDGCHEFTIEASSQEEKADFGNKAKPQVLGETTEELAKTGASTGKAMFVGLTILSALGALHFLSVRRKNYAN